ncbi:MAG: GyrI-like domain-containing protein [Alphaproteobacteria bacterium]
MSGYEVKAGLAEIDAFDVIGISVRTDNTKGTEDINKLWERFFSESTGQFISDKVNDNIYAVYHDYEGDHESPYRLTIGYRVKPEAQTPADMTRIAVADQDYAVMSAAGEQPKALIETWQAIWSGDLPRSFKTDFELYGPRFFEDGINEVLVHIGIEP